MPDSQPPLCGDKLRQARCSAGLSLDLAAQMLGRSPHTLRSWESGRFAPPVRMLTACAELYRADIGSFFPAGGPQGGAHAAA